MKAISSFAMNAVENIKNTKFGIVKLLICYLFLVYMFFYLHEIQLYKNMVSTVLPKNFKENFTLIIRRNMLKCLRLIMENKNSAMK